MKAPTIFSELFIKKNMINFPDLALIHQVYNSYPIWPSLHKKCLKMTILVQTIQSLNNNKKAPTISMQNFSVTILYTMLWAFQTIVLFIYNTKNLIIIASLAHRNTLFLTLFVLKVKGSNTQIQSTTKPYKNRKS